MRHDLKARWTPANPATPARLAWETPAIRRIALTPGKIAQIFAAGDQSAELKKVVLAKNY